MTSGLVIARVLDDLMSRFYNGKMRQGSEIERFLKLTLAVYRVTELFPKEEPLKFQIRESANRILADLFLNQFTSREHDMATHSVLPTRPSGSPHPNPSVRSHIMLSNQIGKMMELFEVAEAQKWVDSRNFLVLRREYGRIEKFIAKESISSGKPVENSLSAVALAKADFPRETFRTRQERDRQQKILTILKEKRKIKVKELLPVFPQLSKRTLIRDLDELFRTGIVTRTGNARASCYNIKS